jgi:hypothetical protein
MIIYKVSVYSVIIIYVNTTSSIKSVEISYNFTTAVCNGMMVTFPSLAINVNALAMI